MCDAPASLCDVGYLIYYSAAPQSDRRALVQYLRDRNIAIGAAHPLGSERLLLRRSEEDFVDVSIAHKLLNQSHSPAAQPARRPLFLQKKAIYGQQVARAAPWH